MKTDYKFWYIKRGDNIHIDEVAVRFYEGEVTTENELDRSGNLIPITRYRRSKRLRKSDLEHLVKQKKRLEPNGNEAVIYTSKDFGTISSDDELRVFLNKELRKDNRRSPVDEQNTLDIRKVK